jgi:two-component system LytT family response regulator
MDRPAMKTLIVDDEPMARQVLREDLDALPEVVVVGEAENGIQALERVGELKPDLMFLDLQMPVMGGFEVVRKLAGAQPPMVVMVTAYDQHALQAFEAGAIDYLLKPVSEGRLQKAVERARTSSAVLRPNFGAANRRVVGRNGSDYFLLDPDEILAFQAEGELVWIVTSKQRLLGTQTLRALEERLKDRHFERVHRNAIVNVNHVRKMTALSSQRWMITLSNALQLVVSKRRAHSIRQILH